MLWSYFTGSKSSLYSALLNWLYSTLKDFVPAAKIPAIISNLYWKIKAIIDALFSRTGGHVTWAALSGIVYDVANTIMVFFPGLYWWKAVNAAWSLVNVL